MRKGCAFDVQLHAGACEDPRDFNGGWEKIYVLENAIATSYDTNELGALDADQNVIVNETVPLSGDDWYEIKRIVGSEIGSAQVVQEIVGIVICDSRQCGECGISSNGCEKIFAVSLNTGGSPGLGAQVLFSPDAGATVETTVITTLGATNDPNGIACSGVYLAVISNEDGALHYALLADILLGTETWTKVTTGIVGGKEPNAIFSLGSVFNWVVGDGGYIYFSDDITSGLTVQSAGGASVQNLADIHGADELNLAAVGASNTVILTHDGGTNWSAVTGPVPGVDLTCVFVKSAQVIFVGSAAGRLYYTQDAGANWTEKAFSGNGSGSVNDIQFSTPTVGYMATQTGATKGRVYRTIDGGFSWYILPEAAGLSLPQSDSILALAACSEDPNLAFAGGLADDGSDGVLIKIG